MAANIQDGDSGDNVSRAVHMQFYRERKEQNGKNKAASLFLVWHNSYHVLSVAMLTGSGLVHSERTLHLGSLVSFRVRTAHRCPLFLFEVICPDTLLLFVVGGVTRERTVLAVCSGKWSLATIMERLFCAKGSSMWEKHFFQGELVSLPTVLHSPR